MRKILVAAIVIVILVISLIGGYVYFSGMNSGPQVPATYDDSHFTVVRVSCPLYFSGDDVIVQAVVLDDEPLREIAVPTRVMVSTNYSNGTEITSAVPTEIVQLAPGYCTHTITAELNGSGNIGLVRQASLTLINNKSQGLSFDFGPLPAGSYVVTVTAPSYNASRKSIVLSVNPSPSLDDWTVTGDAAFMFVNILHDSVDVSIRNSGSHTVILGNGSGQYLIYANSSDDFGVPLLGLDKTLVLQGQTVTINATIPAAGRYYLDHFAICVPGRSSLVRIPVKTWIDA